MGVQSFAVILTTIALSDYFIVANARRLHGRNNRHTPPGPPGHNWVWVPYGAGKPPAKPVKPAEPSSSSSSADDWYYDGWDDDGPETTTAATEHAWSDDGWGDDDHVHIATAPATIPAWNGDGWSDDGHVPPVDVVEPWIDDGWVEDDHVHVATIPVEPWSDDGHATSTVPPPPLTMPPPPLTMPPPPITIPPPPFIEPWQDDDWEGDGNEEIVQPIDAPKDDDEEEEEEEKEEYKPPPKIVGSARTNEEAGKNPDMHVGAIIGAVVAAAVLTIGLVLFAKKKRSAANKETEIDPEADDLMLEEDHFIGDPNDPDADIPPPPPPMQANEDAIEIDQSFLGTDPEDQASHGSEEEDDVEEIVSVASDDLESI